MSDRRTFLGNAAAVAVIAKISPLRLFGFTSDDPQTIHPTISDREKAGLRGPVKQCTEETIMPGVQGGPEIRLSQTTEYDPDGRILSTANISKDGSKWWVTTNTYDDNGRLTKTIAGNATEPGPETLYAYDEAGRLLSITKSGKEGGSKTEFHYDEQGRKTAVQSFDPKTRTENSMFVGSPWDAALAGFGIPAGGNVTTIYDGNDHPTEARIHDAEGRIVSRIVRTYDANGRIMEENQIYENPALLMAAGQRADFNDKQLETMNKAMKSILSGRNGTGRSYTYDPQGRVIEVRERNSLDDTVTTTSYNEHGDESEERTTRTGSLPDVTAFSIDENGTLIPERASVALGPPQTEVIEYRYEYDRYGNWTQQTENHSYGSDIPPNVRHRKLTYY